MAADKEKTDKSKETKKEDKKKEDKKEEEDEGVQFDNLEKLYEAFSTDLLKELLEGNSAKIEKKSNKKKLVEGAVELAKQKGLKALYEVLSKSIAKAALEGIGQKVEHDNKTKMIADFKAALKAKGQADFFKALPVEVLNSICERLDFKEEGDKDEVEAALAEELLAIGAKTLLDSLKKEFCTDVAKDLKLKTNGSKEDLINRICGQVFPHLLEHDKADTKGKKKGDKKSSSSDDPNKKAIEKGVTAEDLYQYYSEELTEYCKKHELKSTGNKKEVIKRILQFLGGDEAAAKPLKPGERRNKRRRTSTSSKSKKSKKEKDDKPDADAEAFKEKVKELKRKRVDELLAQSAKKQKK